MTTAKRLLSGGPRRKLMMRRWPPGITRVVSSGGVPVDSRMNVLSSRPGCGGGITAGPRFGIGGAGSGMPQPPTAASSASRIGILRR